MLAIQPGDVPNTWADIDDLVEQINYRPNTSINQGIKKFSDWFCDYYKI